MSKCLYLRFRTKQGIRYQYCIKNRSRVEYGACNACLDKEFKQAKPIKKIRENKERVSKETYNQVFERDHKECVLCGSQEALQLHHVNGRGKGKTDNPDNCIMLCAHCHLEVVHKDMKKWRPILNEMLAAKKK